MYPNPRIGVFDSGIGGRSVADALQKAFPNAAIHFVSDSEHVPYGDKPPKHVLSFVMPILQELAQKSDIIVIACNSVTTMFIGTLRAALPVPIVGIEPMIKPASAYTKTGIIAVCATPMTLASPRYVQLKEQYARHIQVLEPECSTWAYMIEHNEVNKASIKAQVDAVCEAGADVIVLGCTHYHWIQQVIQDMARNRAIVIQPEVAVVRRVGALLDAQGF